MAYITYTERLIIEKLYNAGAKYVTIAKHLGRAVSSIWREVQRGLYDHLDGATWITVKRYSADIAQQDADYKATAKGKPIKLGHNYAYADEISRRIKAGESPDSIVGDLKRRGKWTVCTTTLYSYIENGYIPGVTVSDLLEKPRIKKKRKRRIASRAPAGTSIEKRNCAIDTRKEFGHWELDSVIGKAQGRNQSILVLTERKTRYEIILKVPSKESKETVKSLRSTFRKYGNIFKSITVDNGSEFSDADGMSKNAKGLKVTQIYYCHPYSSYERGSNENCNRIIRRFFPKGSDFSKLTKHSIKYVQDRINFMHRRILNYATAQELFESELSKMGLKIPS